jgi:hypothetical protein
MGFRGTFVIHRGEQPLREWLPGDIGDDGGRDHEGWRVTRVDAGLEDLPAGFLTGLRDRTGAPVLAADVLDSSAALVEGVGVRTPAWRVWLKPDSAMGYLMPPVTSPDPDLEGEVTAARARLVAGAVAAPAAIAWASEAGWEPGSPDRVVAALEDDDVFVEDVFFELLEVLGLPPGEEVAPAPSVAEVLDGLTGRRLEAVFAVAHRPGRDDEIVHPGMADLLLRFDDGQVVSACCCDDQLTLLPANADTAAQAAQIARTSAEPTKAAEITEAANAAEAAEITKVAETAEAAETAGVGAGWPAGPLTDWATIRYRNFPDLRGMVLHFADRPLLIAADYGEWTIIEAAAPPEHLNELKLNQRPRS